MRTLQRFFLLLLTLLASAAMTFAQTDGDAAGGAACGVFACGIFVYFLVIALMLGLGVFIIVLIYKFIKKDAIARGMPNASTMPWLALAGLMGLLIYVLIRPQGNVMPCPLCGKQRMQGLPSCPQCGGQ